MPKNQIKNPVPDLFTDGEWRKLVKEDPTLKIFAASPWQGASALTKFSEDPIEEKVSTDGKSKEGHPYWRDIQVKGWDKYRKFGPINAAVNSKADYAVGAGFGAYSDNIEINLFLKDLIYSYRNKLYTRIIGWLIREIAEGELFLLLVFDEEGKSTIRTLEPARVGDSEDSGLILNPDDATQTLFYKYGDEIIPDVNIGFDPTLQKLVKDKITDTEKLKKSKGGRKFAKLGGYRRFILHWKNLTGILEYERDTASLSSSIEPTNLYWNVVKWQVEHKKALAAYANVFKFEDTTAGKIAWHLWQKMTDDQKKATGLTAPIAPGARIFLQPGLTYETKAPQLQSLSGENQDLLNIAGSGVRSPQDLFQGQSAGATYASLKASRSPLEMEIGNLQYKSEMFLRYELLRFCFYAKSLVGGFPATFKQRVVEDIVNGNPKIIEIDVEPCELVKITFPNITFDDQLMQKVAGFLGNKHAGLSGIGVSDERIACELGIDDLSREKSNQILEREKYGEPSKEPVQ